jgi:hypothetical protein
MADHLPDLDPERPWRDDREQTSPAPPAPPTADAPVPASGPLAWLGAADRWLRIAMAAVLLALALVGLNYVTNPPGPQPTPTPAATAPGP